MQSELRARFSAWCTSKKFGPATPYSNMLYGDKIHVILKKALKTFWLKHPSAKTPLEAWHKLVDQSELETFAQIKQVFNSADYMPPYYVFDIAGNHFRIISIVHFNRQKLYVRHVLTHAEYDRWNQA